MTETPQQKIERLERRIVRERNARLEAEQLLREKAMELYAANERLHEVLRDLEQQVLSRTENLRVALEEAKRANSVKSEFLAMISHEIRTPMNAIHGMSQLLEESGLSEEHQSMNQLILKSSNALISIVNDLLDLSKIEAGKLELEEVSFQLQDTVDGVVDIYNHRAKRKSMKLVTTYGESVSGDYRGDPGRIRQVLINLVDNAIKYAGRGTVTITVEHAGTRDNREVLRFSVIDEGDGIPEQMRSRLFQKFDRMGRMQAHDTEGAGLGLALCKQLAELMMGNIGAENNEGGGTRFWFTVPLEPLKLEASSPELGDQTPVELEQRPLRILVAEDNPANQMVIRMMLQKLGHTVEGANNGQEAIDALEIAPFDLILMDMQMPVLDGIETTRKIINGKGRAAKTPIVALTANAMDEDRQRCFDAGMVGFISKPVSRDALILALARHARPAAE